MIVIVGGGPAGLTTALAAVRAAPWLADRITVLEKHRYPRDKPCAGALGARGERILRELGARVSVPRATVRGLSLRTAAGARALDTGRRIGAVYRRLELDAALAEEVRRRGVRVEDGCAVRSVRPAGAGAVVETERGELSARLVVGADGVGSVVRRSMGLSRGALRAQVVEIDTAPAPGDPDRALLHFDVSDPTLDGYAWDFPTLVDGEARVCRGVYRLRIRPAAEDLGRRLDDRLAAVGLDPDRAGRKRYAERGFSPPERLVDHATLLVGEAAGVDPVTGEGIPQAIEWGRLAGRFLADVQRGRRAVWEWDRVARGSRLGRDLSIRAHVASRFYGPDRAAITRALDGCPSVLHLAAAHFAAEPFPLRHVLAALAWAPGLLARGIARSGLAQLAD